MPTTPEYYNQGMLHVLAFILRNETDPHETGLRMEFYPMLMPVIEELVPAMRDFVIQWMMAKGYADDNSVLISIKKPDEDGSNGM